MVEITKWVECKICENGYCEHCGEARFIAACSGYTTKPKPQTNADRIRAMSDEELAAFAADRNVDESLMRLMDERDAYTLAEAVRRAMREKLYLQYLHWLKQPVKDGENE